MGYQALLFCPDEKTARTVTHVLNDLDFTVEPCSEPFAAVKKLMAQHFDAVVVDCDNEQNATLLFKSARNSSANQSSLAVAVVEGQAGVAKAFRIGANLVLTKPINVEQAKGTLRVARGLLRKGAEAKNAAAPAAKTMPPAAPVARPATPSVTPASATTPKSAPAPKGPPAPMAPKRPPVAQAAPPAVPPLAFAQAANVDDHEPDTILEPDDGEILETPPAPPVRAAAPPPPAAGTSKFPWQPTKPMAEPMGSALRRAAEAAAKTDPPAEPPARGLTFHSAEDRLSASSGMSAGQATAPAPAKEKPLPVAPPPFVERPVAETPVVAKSSVAEISEPGVFEAKVSDPRFSEPRVSETRIDEPSSSSSYSSSRALNSEEVSPPTFFPGGYDPDEVEGGGKTKALIIVAAVVLLACSAGYLSWRNMSGKGPGQTPSTQTAPAPASATPTSEATKPTQKPSAAPEPEVSEITLGGNSSAPATKPSATKAQAPKEPAAFPAESEPEPEVTQRLIVKNDTHAPKPAAPAQEQEVVPAPSPIEMGAATDQKALAALNAGAAATPKMPEQVVKVSQGVMEGLILKRVQPRYPPQAMQMHIQGSVQLQATISKTGDITNLKVISGDGILSRAAQEAVKQWKYKPYYLNGDPVEIQTQILVNFKLPN
jgi:periplasmic protein TonB